MRVAALLRSHYKALLDYTYIHIPHKHEQTTYASYNIVVEHIQ
jgi:hypothetical protein